MSSRLKNRAGTAGAGDDPPLGGRAPTVAVIGGSLIGLTAALVLRDIGCAVDVYERSPAPLQGRGVGIVLHPMTVRYLLENGLVDVNAVSTSARHHRYLAEDGTILADAARLHYFTGYDTLYRTLLGAFGVEGYHLGHEAVDIDLARDRVEITFRDGRLADADLLLAADGISSFTRRKMCPDLKERYGGYVAWRGVVDERELSEETQRALDDSLTYFVGARTHALTYPIPNYDSAVDPGRRLMNFVWYRNVPEGEPLDALLSDRTGKRRHVSVPPGSVREKFLVELREAAEQLPPPFTEVARKARDPFVQVIIDVEVPHMAFDRVCLVGDAAFSVRPHAAAATAKGAADVWALSEAMVHCGGDVREALRLWEPSQLELGRALLERNRQLGEGAQFRQDWMPGDTALTFGLREPGDSADMPT